MVSSCHMSCHLSVVAPALVLPGGKSGDWGAGGRIWIKLKRGWWVRSIARRHRRNRVPVGGPRSTRSRRGRGPKISRGVHVTVG